MGSGAQPMTREGLMAFLGAQGIETRTVEHPPLFTVEESRALRGDIPGGHTKNLFLKDRKGALILVVAEEDRPVDLKTLHKAIGAQGRLSFAGADQMRACLGVEPGAVTAFGVVNDGARRVRVVLDAGLLSHDIIHCHPLTNTATTAIRRDDLLKFLAATGHAPAIVALDEAASQVPADEPQDEP